MELNEFRKELEKATQGIPSKHPENIYSLSKDYSYSITVQCNPNFMDATSDCFIYVFKEKIPEELIKKIYKVSQKTPENSRNLLQELLDNGFVELHDTKNIGDTVIVYFDNGIVKHFGKIEKDKIISKWGKGHIWKHIVFEVPISYGNTVKYSNGKIKIEVLETVLNNIIPI